MTKSRVATFKLIYEYLFLKEYQEITLNFLKSDDDLTELDVIYVNKVYNGVIDKMDELVKDIENHTENFSIDRIFKADFALLLLAIYEMKYMNKIPFKVTINEVLNISKEYSTKKSSKYINGILAGVYKDIENANN